MAGVLRAVTLGETRGFVKVLVNVESDRILGFTAFGAEGSEMMAAVQTAMLGGLRTRSCAMRFSHIHCG